MANINPFKLRFQKKDIQKWAKRYPIETHAELEHSISPCVKARGFFLPEEFALLCRWKTPRTKSRVLSNTPDYIEAITKTALSTPSERLRIEVLLLLKGVSWPTASVILHFCHTEQYPILDFRALWSLGIDSSKVPYNFEFWQAYTEFCRNLADEANVSMRELDRALWQYSREHQ